MKLKNCPCCLGDPELIEVATQGVRMWQVTCLLCGLSSELLEDKALVADRWNERQESKQAKTWITLLGALLPFLTVASFLIGSLFGMNL